MRSAYDGIRRGATQLQAGVGRVVNGATQAMGGSVTAVTSMFSNDEMAKKAVATFLKELANFYLMAQKTFNTGLSAYNLRQSAGSQTTVSWTNSSTTSPAESANNTPGMTNYWLASFIALIYGSLGLSTLIGIFVYAWCTGKAKEVGWRNIFLDNVISGNKLLHFMAHFACLIGGATGIVTVGLLNRERDGVYYLGFVMPVFLFFASVLDKKATFAKQSESGAADEVPDLSVGGNHGPSGVDLEARTLDTIESSRPRSPLAALSITAGNQLQRTSSRAFDADAISVVSDGLYTPRSQS